MRRPAPPDPPFKAHSPSGRLASGAPKQVVSAQGLRKIAARPPQAGRKSGRVPHADASAGAEVGRRPAQTPSGEPPGEGSSVAAEIVLGFECRQSPPGSTDHRTPTGPTRPVIHTEVHHPTCSTPFGLRPGSTRSTQHPHHRPGPEARSPTGPRSPRVRLPSHHPKGALLPPAVPQPPLPRAALGVPRSLPTFPRPPHFVATWSLREPETLDRRSNEIPGPTPRM